jgi:hypothetical protein
MPRATINIPVEHVAAIRESLEACREDIEHRPCGDAHPDSMREIDALLEQLSPYAAEAGRSVSGARHILWHAAYDALCAGAESFASDCNDLWRGRLTVHDVRDALSRLEERLDLLDALEVPPMEP